jgi:hypothetical protein
MCQFRKLILTQSRHRLLFAQSIIQPKLTADAAPLVSHDTVFRFTDMMKLEGNSTGWFTKKVF